MLSAVIVDDEELARATLSGFLEKYCPNVEIVGKAGSAVEGYELITKLKPNLVFLDVEMPEKNGFDLLDMFDKIDFHIIFATAYGHYAIDAIKYSALDYVLKPIDIEDLKNAVNKAEKTSDQFREGEKVDSLLANLKSGEKLKQLVIPEIGGFKIVQLKEILFLKADGNYTCIYYNSKKLMATKLLKEYDDMLSPLSFMRVNKSFLVNLNHVVEYKRGEGGFAILSDGSEIEISRRRKAEFIDKVKSL